MYIKRLAENFVQKALSLIRESATPRLADTESRFLVPGFLGSLVPWNRFLGSINVSKYGLRLSPGIDSKEPIPLDNVA